MFEFQRWVIGVGCVAAAAGCNQVAMTTEEIGQNQEALCANGDGTNSTMAALAVATAKELGRWQSSRDFFVDEAGRLALTDTGRARCADGECWNTQALLDLQGATPGEVEIGGVTFNPEVFNQSLVENFGEQLACEAHPGDSEESCSAEEHRLNFKHQREGACDTVFTFLAKDERGRALRHPEQLKNKLIFAGYPENEFLSFKSRGSLVSIDPTYGLNPGGSTTTGSCTAACTKISSTNITGQCCTCNGYTRTFVRSAWSAVTYVCQ